jgi:hypothetical protein
MKNDKGILLMAISILLITFFFVLPQNNNWERQTIMPYWMDFLHQKNRTNPEGRKESRYGNAYTISKAIAGFFEKKHIKDSVLVLMPPEAYFDKYGISYAVPEPAVFYYYTGLKTTWAHSSLAGRANWYVHVIGNDIRMDSFTNQQAIKDTLRSYKKFPYPL